ncbi:hypothetical protein [Novosphingobium aquae]|uniref:Pyridine nucleotide-disulfide oxidoreductase n=1 Tax=Novosphingobium aquae TaxID=3133435 RepID=A0ABU8SDH4_9SPHN
MASRAEKIAASRQQPRLTAGLVERFVSVGVLCAVVAAIVFGWLHRKESWINPEQGVGYALGIIGGSLMIALLAYPIRKRTRSAPRAAGSVGFWFRLHMFMGLMGPLAILYHSRFTWGALNSAFALGAMIVVASSGLIGRFFYSRVHRGYSDRKLEVRALKQEMDEKLAAMQASGAETGGLLERIQPFEDRAVRAGSNFWSSAAAVAGLGYETRRVHRSLLADLPRGADLRTERLRSLLGDYFEAVRRAAEFAFYDRLLRLWHLLHLPLFILLVAAAVLHIVAVHMY